MCSRYMCRAGCRSEHTSPTLVLMSSTSSPTAANCFSRAACAASVSSCTPPSILGALPDKVTRTRFYFMCAYRKGHDMQHILTLLGKETGSARRHCKVHTCFAVRVFICCCTNWRMLESRCVKPSTPARHLGSSASKTVQADLTSVTATLAAPICRLPLCQETLSVREGRQIHRSHAAKMRWKGVACLL